MQVATPLTSRLIRMQQKSQTKAQMLLFTLFIDEIEECFLDTIGEIFRCPKAEIILKFLDEVADGLRFFAHSVMRACE